MSYKRFRIETLDARLPTRVPRIEVSRNDACVNCGRCATACVYGVHSRQDVAVDLTKMAEPEHALCVACQRCVNECPVDALNLAPHPDHLAQGDSYWTPEVVTALIAEADDGQVPVSGAGYRGPFSGPGWDSMWTDMSEIVRPTRDGIGGRETISTEIELGAKPERVETDSDGRLRRPLAPLVRLSLPVVFAPPPGGDHPLRRALASVFAETAHAVGTLAILDEGDAASVPEGLRRAVRFSGGSWPEPERYRGLVFVELKDHPGAADEAAAVRVLAPEVVVSILVPLTAMTPGRCVALAKAGVAVVHLQATPHGRALDSPAGRPVWLHAALRETNEALAASGLRDRFSLLVSGGIARAEHVAKAMLCGADAAAVEVAALVALGMRRFNGDLGLWAPGEADLSEPARAVQRLKNLTASWREQLLEVMGAMGIRDARRLEGEEGRALFQEILELEFRSLFTTPSDDEHDPTYG